MLQHGKNLIVFSALSPRALLILQPTASIYRGLKLVASDEFFRRMGDLVRAFTGPIRTQIGRRFLKHPSGNSVMTQSFSITTWQALGPLGPFRDVATLSGTHCDRRAQ